MKERNNSKEFYNQWWFWSLIVFTIISVAFIFSGSSNEASQEDNRSEFEIKQDELMNKIITDLSDGTHGEVFELEYSRESESLTMKAIGIYKDHPKTAMESENTLEKLFLIDSVWQIAKMLDDTIMEGTSVDLIHNGEVIYSVKNQDVEVDKMK